MRRIVTFSLASVGLCLLWTGAGAADMAADPKAAFARLKALEGDWEGHGDSPAGFPVRIEYRLTGAGSAVTERLFPGTDHEMLTVYFMDGHDLVLTHFCAGANQPRMRLVAGGAEGELKFDFAGGSNVDAQRGSHMHSAVFTTLQKDRLQATWSSVTDGKPAGGHTFYMARSGAPATK